MASILIDVEKGIETGAADVLKFLTSAQKELQASPQVVAALGVLLGAAATAVADTSAAAAAGGVNIALDGAALVGLKAVWPDIEAFAKTLGIKL